LTEIGDWFNRWPGANLAVVTGIVSALVVLDLDPKRGGNASLQQLAREQGRVPETVEAMVGSRRQLYFSHPGGIVQDRPDLVSGIDLHGDGGYVLAPPSVDASGEEYRWTRSPEVFHLEKLPAWLTSISASSGTATARQPQPWRHFLRTGAADGGRRNAVAVLAEHLLDSEVDPEVALELMLCWNAARCRPPLAADEVADTIEHIESSKRNLS
jgi:hypothetical protein